MSDSDTPGVTFGQDVLVSKIVMVLKRLGVPALKARQINTARGLTP